MSYAAKRQEIVDALNASELVKAYIYKPSAPKAGDAWIRLGNSIREGTVFEDSWLVLVHLPQSEASADKWRDENQNAVVNALEETDTGFVDEIVPVNLGSDTNPVFGLQFNFRS